MSSDDQGELVEGQEVVQGLDRKHVAGAASKVLDEAGRRLLRLELELGRFRNVVRIGRKRVVPEVFPD